MLKCMICGKSLNGEESKLTLVSKKGEGITPIADYPLCDEHKTKEFIGMLTGAIDKIIAMLRKDYEFGIDGRS